MGSCVSEDAVLTVPITKQEKSPVISDRTRYIISCLEQQTFPMINRSTYAISAVFICITPETCGRYTNFSVYYNVKCKNTTDMIKKAVIHLLKLNDEDVDKILEHDIYPLLMLHYNVYLSIFELQLTLHNTNGTVHTEVIYIDKPETVHFLELVTELNLTFRNYRGDVII